MLVKNMETISVDWTTIFTPKTDHSLLRFNMDNLHDKILVPESGIYLANVPPKFRTVLKVEKYIHPGGVGFITPPEKYLLHDREILSVLCLRHFESLYHVMYFFGFQDCSKFMNILILPLEHK